MHLLSRKLFRGEQRAERRSRQGGSSLEFADYRNYSLGDDLRNVDWNIYGRLDRLFVKLFEEEQDLHVHLMVDASGSMRWQPDRDQSASKWDQARRIAASLAYLALANLDRVNIHFFSATLGNDVGMLRGKSQFHRVLEFLEQRPPVTATTCLLPALRTFTQRVKRRGLIIIISDFFDPEGYEESLALLRHHRFEVHLVQVLHPAELKPAADGDLRLVECETDETWDVTSDAGLRRRYDEAVATFLAELEAFCRKRQVGYLRASTALPFEDVVLRVLRGGRLIG